MARESNDRPKFGASPGAGSPPPGQPADRTGSLGGRSPAGLGSSESADISPFGIGDLVADRYRVKSFLGRGGMGEVFEVEDRILGTSVALKTIRPREADRAEAVERFKREINVARRVTHANVCRIFDVGTHQGTGQDGKVRETLFLTMELLAGENLLGITLTAEVSRQAEAAWPGSLEASRKTAEGISHFQAYAFPLARKAFEEAVLRDPKAAAPQLGLIATLSAVGDLEQARKEVKVAEALLDQLPARTQLWVNGQMRDSTGDWARAIQSYRALLSLAPDDLDCGLRLAEALTTSGKAKDALETIDSLRHLAPPLSTDPRIDLAAARAARALGDKKQQFAYAAQSSAEALARDAKSVAATSRLLESSAMEGLGDRKGGTLAAEEAQRLYEAVGDRGGAALKGSEALSERLDVATTRTGLARLALASGNSGEAIALARQAEEVLRSEKAADPQIDAAIVMAEALLAQGKGTESAEAETAIATMAAATSDSSVQFAASLLKARILGASGKTTAAIEILDRVRLNASQKQLVEYDLRARLALGETEIRGGRATAGRARLQALIKDAAARGFGLIARQAKEMSSRWTND